MMYQTCGIAAVPLLPRTTNTPPPASRGNHKNTEVSSGGHPAIYIPDPIAYGGIIRNRALTVRYVSQVRPVLSLHGRAVARSLVRPGKIAVVFYLYNRYRIFLPASGPPSII